MIHLILIKWALVAQMLNQSYDELTHITPLAYDHIRVLDRYTFTLNRYVQQGALRPLKPLRLK